MNSLGVSRALILSGGGARCAYHVGVLRGIARILRGSGYGSALLFDILCGASGGAINAVSLASYPEHFGLIIKKLFADWSHLSADDVYSRFLLRHYWRRRASSEAVTSRYLLSNAPLAARLQDNIHFAAIHDQVMAGHLGAVVLSAFSYSTHQQVSFIDTALPYEPWSYPHSFSVSMPLSVSHVLASSSVPFVFPAQPIDMPDGTTHFFGDGSIRELSPLYAAMSLGARDFLIIGTDRRTEVKQALSWGNMARSFFSSTFSDALSADCARLAWLPEPARVLSFFPSEDLTSYVDVDHMNYIPRSLRMLARLISGEADFFLLSHFLFESSFINAVLRLGEYDALCQVDEVLAFFARP